VRVGQADRAFLNEEATVSKSLKSFSALLALIAIISSTQALAVSVPISSSDGASWTRSSGGTGTAMNIGGPGVWNSKYVTAIPPGATNISFTLDSFAVDDKGVVQLNGSTIGDGVIFGANGAAAGLGTFDFGLGGGSQAYNYVGFTPGAAIGLPNGTTNFTLTGYVNDTGTSNPSAPPFVTVTVASSFTLSGTLSYNTGEAPAPVNSVPAFSLWGSLFLVLMLAVFGFTRIRRPG